MIIKETILEGLERRIRLLYSALDKMGNLPASAMEALERMEERVEIIKKMEKN
jgi:chromosome segregation ATPase